MADEDLKFVEGLKFIRGNSEFIEVVPYHLRQVRAIQP